MTRILAAAILLALSVPAFGQQLPPTKEWFNSLKNQKGEVCCYDWDGLSLEEDAWTIRGDHYEVAPKGQPIPVPPEAVVTEPNRLGRAHVWMRYDGTVRCFIPGNFG